MSENNESGNRWEAPGGRADQGTDVEAARAHAPVADVQPVPTAAAVSAQATRTSRLPGWVTTRGLLASGAAAAIFIGGGGVGYAVGVHGHDDGNQNVPARFDRSGSGPGQPPGGGQPPTFQQGPQSQSDDSGSASSGSGSSS